MLYCQIHPKNPVQYIHFRQMGQTKVCYSFMYLSCVSLLCFIIAHLTHTVSSEQYLFCNALLFFPFRYLADKERHSALTKAYYNSNSIGLKEKVTKPSNPDNM